MSIYDFPEWLPENEKGKVYEKRAEREYYERTDKVQK